MKSLGKPRVIEESNIGLYIWEMPNGQWIGDDDGNFLNIPSMKGNLERISNLRNAVKSYGIVEGKAVFLSGNRQIDDEEYQNQKRRMAFGLVPDELDMPAYKEDLIHGKV